MKKALILLLLALPLSIYAQKMGVVDESVIKELPQYAEVKAKIAEISDKYKAEYDKLQNDMDKKVTEYQALNLGGNTPENIRLMRIQEIQNLDGRIQEFRNVATADIKQHEDELISELERQFDEVVKAVAEEGGYTVVYRKGSVAYVDSAVTDITPIVKARLLGE